MTRKRSAQRVAVPNTNTIIEFIIDESGSMDIVHLPTISGFNSFLNEQKTGGGTALLSLTKFEGGFLKTPYVDLDVNLVMPLTRDTFVPGGGTNLCDAIGARVRDLEQRLTTWDSPPQVLVVVLTDGQDNQSYSYSAHQIRDLIAAHEAQGWTFVYLGSDAYALQAAAQMGFQPGNAKQFDITKIHDTMETLARATTAYRASAESTTASTTFFA
jgi:hypothetical protein